MTILEEAMKWVLNSNGASNKNRTRIIRVVLESLYGFIVEETFWLVQNLINNEAKYEALIYGMK